MPANLPPQYFIVEAKLKNASTAEEKISIYEELLRIVPKHKGTEKLQKDLKRKIAKLKKEEKKKPKRESIYLVKKEGAGQVVIVGPPNSGKSSLLNALTNAKARVAPFPFATQIPQPGMMPYENILIQLIDTPPITKNFFPGWLREIIREADGLLILLDLSQEAVFQEIENLKMVFKNWRLENKKMIWVGNKIDLEKGKENVEKIKLKADFPFNIKCISVLKRIGLEDLKKEIFDLLEIVRIYTKSPAKEPNFSQPFILRKGQKVIELASQIHEGLSQNFHYAKLLKKDLKKPKIVGKDYLLEDEDIIEIHAR